jgi:tRNA dimethylallyltransferase
LKNTEKIISIVGPTASGKTDVAIELAKLVNGEIISADSRLVYKDFNIGTAKPTAEEMSSVPHYMIDVTEPTETYTVGVYKKEAARIIEDIFSRGKVPIIAGGTGFYVKALLEGLDIPEVKPDIEFRTQMRELEKEKGKEFIHEMLKQSDPKMAEKLHPNDTFRIIRALEVQKVLGQPMSEIQSMSKPKYDSLYIGLNSEDREFLYERINKRVDLMYEQGLFEEVENLIKKYGKTLSLLKTLGYKEVCDHFEGVGTEKAITIEETLEEIRKNTRRFAKRQLTWFRANKNIQWFYIDKVSKNEIYRAVIKAYEK